MKIWKNMKDFRQINFPLFIRHITFSMKIIYDIFRYLEGVNDAMVCDENDSKVQNEKIR